MKLKGKKKKNGEFRVNRLKAVIKNRRFITKYINYILFLYFNYYAFLFVLHFYKLKSFHFYFRIIINLNLNLKFL